MKDNGPKNIRLSRRVALLGGAQLAVVGALGFRMRQLGIEQSEQYQLLAEENRVNLRLLPPARGLIFDRAGEPVTVNRREYTIEIVREQARDPEMVLRRLQKLIPITDDEIEKALAEMKKRRAFVPVTVARGLEWEHIAAVSANAPIFPGITPRLALNRQYPKGAEFAHIVGYVGPVSDYDLEQLEDNDPLLLIPRFQIGKNGIETVYDQDLRGKAGVSRIEVNALGRVMRELDRQEGVSGQNIQLTVSNDLQAFALERMRGESASVVVMDVRNGDLVALASAPSFDPNKFVRGISVKDWQALNDPKWRPLINKAVSGTYPPGSTYKMVVALAALEAGLINSSEDIFCPGHIDSAGRRFHCWRSGGHGRVNLSEALRGSCDVYFYELALRVGIERMSAMAKRLGLGTRHDIPLPSIAQGLTPTKDWKKANRDEDWFIGDSVNAGIGQGFVLASPLQLAVMTARIATGKIVNPRLVNIKNDRRQDVPEQGELGVSKRHLDEIRRGMWEVSNHRRGTAFGSRLDGDEEMAGKTGTSQVRFITAEEREQGVIKNEDLPWERRDHALFVGYAPYDDPHFAVTVVVEHGGGGSRAAAPIARDIMQYALDIERDGYGDLPDLRRSQRDGQEVREI